MNDLIPEIIEVWKIAQAIGWPTEKTSKFLKGERLVHKMGMGCSYVMRDAFESTLPTVYRVFVSKYKAGLISSKRGRVSVKRTVKPSKKQEEP